MPPAFKEIQLNNIPKLSTYYAAKINKITCLFCKLEENFAPLRIHTYLLIFFLKNITLLISIYYATFSSTFTFLSFIITTRINYSTFSVTSLTILVILITSPFVYLSNFLHFPKLHTIPFPPFSPQTHITKISSVKYKKKSKKSSWLSIHMCSHSSQSARQATSETCAITLDREPMYNVCIVQKLAEL